MHRSYDTHRHTHTFTHTQIHTCTHTSQTQKQIPKLNWPDETYDGGDDDCGDDEPDNTTDHARNNWKNKTQQFLRFELHKIIASTTTNHNKGLSPKLFPFVIQKSEVIVALLGVMLVQNKIRFRDHNTSLSENSWQEPFPIVFCLCNSEKNGGNCACQKHAHPWSRTSLRGRHQARHRRSVRIQATAGLGLRCRCQSEPHVGTNHTAKCEICDDKAMSTSVKAPVCGKFYVKTPQIFVLHWLVWLTGSGSEKQTYDSLDLERASRSQSARDCERDVRWEREGTSITVRHWLEAAVVREHVKGARPGWERASWSGQAKGQGGGGQLKCKMLCDEVSWLAKANFSNVFATILFRFVSGVFMQKPCLIEDNSRHQISPLNWIQNLLPTPVPLLSKRMVAMVDWTCAGKRTAWFLV